MPEVATCLCGCPPDLHIGDIGCPCGLPWAPVCAGWLSASADYITPADTPLFEQVAASQGWEPAAERTGT